MRWIGWLFCLLSFFSANGQNKIPTIQAKTSLQQITGTGNTMIRTFDNAYQGVKGSPFLFDSWRQGIIVLPDSQLITSYMLKYDAYNDELIIKEKQAKEIYVFNKMFLQSFEIADSLTEQPLIFAKVLYQPVYQKERKICFMQVVWEGENGLYIDHEKEFLKADYRDPYSANRPYDEFRSTITYYLRIGDNPAQKFKPSRKEFYQKFPEYQEQLDVLFSGKPDIKNPQALARIMAVLE